MTTPYYLIDESRMQKAMERIRYVEQHSGAKSVLALKCFSTWCAFDFMRPYLAGTTSSSLYEARLGNEKFGGETHGYSVAYSDDEIDEVVRCCDKVIFNSLSQFERFKDRAQLVSRGLRLNPRIGYSGYQLSNTVCQYSRLGVTADKLPADIGEQIDGVMLHMNCENHDFTDLCRQINEIERQFGWLLPQLSWLSLGGGVAFTSDGYPLHEFSNRLAELAEKYRLQVYLEPGEASVTQSTSLVVSVLDIVDNGLPTLIVDAGVETHLLDVLVYRFAPALAGATPLEDGEVEDAVASGKPVYRVSGRTCLAGDVFGTYVFEQPVALGQTLSFTDVASYSMVKKNFFNGIRMPSIHYKNLNGETRIVREFAYEDFRDFLS
ncbi:carboxynorspermidine decarboxylase [Spongiibacter taiwanensis]|uniref:carboxynorspermidine decarboxylase n=1 Tax=Spongiibacter taiwanensis TaxID=1748242 RepID=UPI002035A8D1|nr:carboxynorspermidine decarboxylase [Spongiibacter taiwanensis]USA42686.1 carboxynorspermidine decarboxylase [Spongiibacter taiwanensis]